MTSIDATAAKAQLQREGFAIIPGVLSPEACADVRARLWRAAEESERRGAPTRNIGIDPNEHNVRVFNLLDLDPVFVQLIGDPLAIDLVRSLLGPGFLISNFTANIALPGSQSMKPHSDQSIVVPEPWLEPWSMNVIWCLNDVHAANGATLYLPMSHKIAWAREAQADPRAGMQPFEAPAGAVIAMDGRLCTPPAPTSPRARSGPSCSVTTRATSSGHRRTGTPPSPPRPSPPSRPRCTPGWASAPPPTSTSPRRCGRSAEASQC
jgi:fumagillin biosynthesis dioxygenase